MTIDTGLSHRLRDHIATQTALIEDKQPVACKICDATAEPFGVVDLFKSCEAYPQGLSGVPVYYHRCGACGFVFTRFFDRFDGDEWRDIIYNDYYYERIDPDYAERRPRHNRDQLVTILRGRERRAIGLDYGGGNGRTAALMRERGYRYDSYDPYGDSELHPEYASRYDVCSAFEVAEHTPDPRDMMAQIVARCSSGPLTVLIGTLAQDDHMAAPTGLGWWYAAPRNGHVSLYSRRSLQMLGEQVGLSLISFNASQHLFFRGHSAAAVRRSVIGGKIRARLGRLVGRGG